MGLVPTAKGKKEEEFKMKTYSLQFLKFFGTASDPTEMSELG